MPGEGTGVVHHARPPVAAFRLFAVSAGLSRRVVPTSRFAFSLKVNVTPGSMRRRFGALIFRDIKEVLAMNDAPGL